MKILVVMFCTSLLSACSWFNQTDDPAIDGPPEGEYDEATYYYWPNQGDPVLIYEVVSYEDDGCPSELPRIVNLEHTHPLIKAVNQTYQQEATEYRKTQAEFEAELKADGSDYAPMPWDYSVSWLGGNYHPNLWSLAFQVYSYSGGAHPNHWTNTFNYQPQTNQILELADLFTGPEYETPLAIAIGDALIAEKQKRWDQFNGQTYDVTQDFFMQDIEFEGDAINRWVVAQQDGEVGLMFFFSPYDVGPYAEGGYEVFIPNTVFAEWLKPSLGFASANDEAAVSDSKVIEAGKTVLELIKNEDFATLAQDFIGTEGVWFSLSTNLEEVQQTLNRQQVANTKNDKTEYLWGYGDGSGLPIEQTIQVYLRERVSHKDFASGEAVVNEIQTRATNCLNTLQTLAPEHQWVEFYLPATAEGGFDWASRYLIFKPNNQRLDLVGIANHQWCI